MTINLANCRRLSQSCRSLNVVPEAPVLVIVASLIPYKVHHDLIEALAIANLRMLRNWQVLIAGRDGGIGQDLRRRAAEPASDARLSFLGSRSDVPGLLPACDIALSCLHEEGFSNAILDGVRIADDCDAGVILR